jgi:gas vesicle protein
MRTLKVLLGVLAGFAAGAALGVMFAPAKGYRTRRRLISKGEDLRALIKDRAEEKFEELVDKLGEKRK